MGEGELDREKAAKAVATSSSADGLLQIERPALSLFLCSYMHAAVRERAAGDCPLAEEGQIYI